MPKNKKENRAQRVGSGKLFLISFLTAAILLTLLFAIYHRSMLGKEVPTDQLISGITVVPPEYTAADNVRFLVLYDADLSGSDIFAAAVCCNAATGIVTSCEIDLRLTAFSAGSHTALSDQYRLRGTKGIRDGIENLLHAEFDAVIRCDRKGLSAIINLLGGVILQPGDLPQIDRASTANAWYFAGQFDTPSQRNLLFARLTERCFRDEKTLSAAKTGIFRYCDTDLSAYDALNMQDVLEYLAEKQQFSILSLTAQKIEMGTQTLYIPDPDTLSILQKTLR